MKANIVKLTDFVKKATVNYSIDQVQILIDDDRIKSAMISSANDVVSILNSENDIFFDLPKGNLLEFNFHDPATTLIKLIGMLDSEEVDFKYDTQSIIFKHGRTKAQINFASQFAMRTFDPSVKSNTNFLLTLPFDSELAKTMDKIKRIGSLFNKVYFTCKDNELILETTDKTAGVNTGFSQSLVDLKSEDFSACFRYGNIVNLLSLLKVDEYEFRLSYDSSKKILLLYCFNNDESERYRIASVKDL